MYLVLVVVIGTTAVLFASYSLVLVGKIFELNKLRKDYASIKISAVKDLHSGSGRVRLRGAATSSAKGFPSVLASLPSFYSRLLVVGQKGRRVKPYEKKRLTGFEIKNDSAGISVDPGKARFIVDRKILQPSEVKNNVADLLPEYLKGCFSDLLFMEEYLAEGSRVTAIGNVRSDSAGNLVLAAEKNKPLIISQCSDEAFQLIHFRFFVRLVLLFMSMMLTALIMFYLLFLFC